MRRSSPPAGTVVRTLILQLPLSCGEPAWEIAHLFPFQGAWSEDEYLDLVRHADNRRVELVQGRIEVPRMPTCLHQGIVGFLALALRAFAKDEELGLALFGPLPVRVGKGSFREPDILFMLAKNLRRLRHEEYWDGADLLMEVVIGGEKDRRRDLVTKRAEYARARVQEYWIVDTQEKAITVLRLRGTRYVVHGKFGRGERATSVLLKGFEVDVSAALSGRGL